MKKKFTAILALIMACMLCLTACGGGKKNEGYKIKVWVSDSPGLKEAFKAQIDAFNKANPDKKVIATVEAVGEGNAANSMLNDVESGADIFCFAQDQLARLVTAGALTKLGTTATETVKAEHDADSIAAATVGGELYCYPLTSDNGYFMYYDKSVIRESSIDSLEAIIADCEAANKLFSMELETSAWYNAAFMFATGCQSQWTTNAAGDFTSVNDTFNSDAGVIALKGMQKLLKSKAYNSSSSASGFVAAVPSAVVVSGTWEMSAAKEALGENFAVADLPSFEVDGKSYHLGSFKGNKLLGVKPQKDAERAAVLRDLALYLTSEECQTQRCKDFGWGPSNLKSQESDVAKSNPTLEALKEQSPYAVLQGQIHGSWWDIAKLYATAAKEATTDAELRAALKSYEDSIHGLILTPAEQKEDLSVIEPAKGTNRTSLN